MSSRKTNKITKKYPKRKVSSAHLAVLEIVEQDIQALALNTIVLDDNARAANNLTRVALTVDLAQTRPGTEDFRISNFDEVDLVLRTERFNELKILRFGTSFDENAKVGLTFVECFGAFTQSAGETIVYERVLQDLLQITKEVEPHWSKVIGDVVTLSASSTDILPFGASLTSTSAGASST